MIYLLQILKMLNKKQKDFFLDIFEDINDEVNELGYTGSEEELVEHLLDSHFNIQLTDPRQLTMLTKSILKKGKVKAAYTVSLLK